MGKKIVLEGVDFYKNAVVRADDPEIPSGYKKVFAVVNSSLTDTYKDNFDTGIKVNNSFVIKCSLTLTKRNVDYMKLFSDLDVTTETGIPITRFITSLRTPNESSVVNIGTNANTSIVLIGKNPLGTHSYEVRGNEFYFDGDLVATETRGSATTHKYSMKVGIAFVKIHSFSIADGNGNLLFDGVPCVREIDGWCGLWDRVGKKFVNNGLQNGYEE